MAAKFWWVVRNPNAKDPINTSSNVRVLYMALLTAYNIYFNERVLVWQLVCVLCVPARACVRGLIRKIGTHFDRNSNMCLYVHDVLYKTRTIARRLLKVNDIIVIYSRNDPCTYPACVNAFFFFFFCGSQQCVTTTCFKSDGN